MTQRVAVVTGGTSGIGAACAEALRVAGHIVVAGSRRAGLNVADQGSVGAFCAAVAAEHGAPLILVNAAGIYQEGAVTDEDTGHWHDQIAVNLTGPYLMTRALMPGMIAAGWGRIVNIASTAGSKGAARYGGYCASKAGLIALSRVTAIEGAPHGVTCVSISPTWVETPMLEAATERLAGTAGKTPAALRESLRGSNPQGRLVQPREIAAIVAFACSDACPALTNEDIQVNAGADW